MFTRLKEAKRVLSDLFRNKKDIRIADLEETVDRYVVDLQRCADTVGKLYQENADLQSTLATEKSEVEHYKSLYQQGITIIVGAQKLFDQMNDFLLAQEKKKVGRKKKS